MNAANVIQGPWREMPDRQHEIYERGAALVWAELAKHGITRPIHPRQCTCHRCQNVEGDPS